MDEKDFLELIISERMGMHHDAFKKEYPPTEERRRKRRKQTRHTSCCLSN